MAGDWIKMRCNLWDDPRVAKICDLTGQSEAAIVGALYWIWATADQHSEDGIMPGLSIKSIDRKTGVQGFGDALVTIGWLADHPEGVRITRFEEHNGQSAKTRVQTAKRVAQHKANAKVTEGALPKECESVSDALPREDIEKSSKPPSLRDVPPLGSAKQKSITFSQWLVATKEKGEKAVSDYKPLWDYARTVQIPDDWIGIAWLKFKDRYTTDEKAKKKRYIDWRGVFLRAVKENWLGLWFYSEKTQAFCLTTVGVCSDLDTREAA